MSSDNIHEGIDNEGVKINNLMLSQDADQFGESSIKEPQFGANSSCSRYQRTVSRGFSPDYLSQGTCNTPFGTFIHFDK